MKKIFLILSVLMLIGVLALTAYAEEPESVVPEESIAESVEESVEEIASEAVAEESAVVSAEEPVKEKNHTLLGRLWQWLTTNKTEVLSFLGDAAIVLIAAYNFLKSHKVQNYLGKGLDKTMKDVVSISTSQDAVVDAVNGMIGGYNKLEEAYHENAGAEDERNRLVGALVAQNTAILEILRTVYANSKNLPQGVKDIVNLAYANVLKEMDDDEKLKATVESVKEAMMNGVQNIEIDKGE